MILTAGALARGVTATVLDTLVVGLGADVVGDRLGELGRVGLLVISADATVHERSLHPPGQTEVLRSHALG